MEDVEQEIESEEDMAEEIAKAIDDMVARLLEYVRGLAD